MTLPLCPSGDSPCGCCSAADTLTHSCARAHTAQSPAFSRRPASLCTELLCSENFFHKMAAMCLLHSKIFILLFRVFFERKTIFLKLFYLVVCAPVHVYGTCVCIWYMYTSDCVFVCSVVSVHGPTYRGQRRASGILLYPSLPYLPYSLKTDPSPSPYLSLSLPPPPFFLLLSFSPNLELAWPWASSGNPPASGLIGRATPGFSRGLQEFEF